MFIDDKGRLFGRFNIVDAAVALAVIAIVALFGARQLGAIKLGGPEEKPVVLEVVTDAITPETLAKLQQDDKLFLIVGLDTVRLGKITSISVKPAEVRVDNSVLGKVIYAPDPKRRQAVITVTGKGTITKQIVTISNNAVLVGDRVSLKTTYARFDAEVTGLKFGE